MSAELVEIIRGGKQVESGYEGQSKGYSRPRNYLSKDSVTQSMEHIP
jgi:hypothetical protein